MDIENYKVDMQTRLQSLPMPNSLQCNDPHCSISSHSSERDTHVLDILCSVVESTHTKLPLAGGRRAVQPGAKTGRTSGNIPVWTEEVEPFRDDALFWHSVWVSVKRPNTGDLYHMMTHSRNQYHYAVRSLKLKSHLVRAEKLPEASIKGDMDLLKEMKLIKNGKKCGEDLPHNVAGADGEDEIVEKFREVY